MKDVQVYDKKQLFDILDKLLINFENAFICIDEIENDFYSSTKTIRQYHNTSDFIAFIQINEQEENTIINIYTESE